jgi:hypothetical protein
MFRRNFPRKNFGPQRGFRWRGGDVTRLEQFSDSAFAFAITLLVVSLEVPRTFSDLLTTMRGFIAFGICFAMLIWLWYEHYLFFRRYGLRDGQTVVINSTLLFVVLFYIYPLKFLFTLLVNAFFVGDIRVAMADGTLAYPMTSEQSPLMMYIYNGGFFLVMGLYWMLYRRALSIREKLQLTPLEVYETQIRGRGFLLCMGIAVASSAIVYFGGPEGSMWGGFFYFAIGPTMFLNGRLSRKKRDQLEALQPSQPAGHPRQSSPQSSPQSQQREQRPQQGPPNQQRQQGQQRPPFNPRREQRGPRPPQQRRNPNEPPKPEPQ